MVGKTLSIVAMFRQLATTPFNFLALSGVTIPKHVGLETKEANSRGFPQGFKVQRIGISTAIAVSEPPPTSSQPPR
jgi:hypothetical protein